MNHFSAMTPLHVAANMGNVEKASLLLKFHSGVNGETPDGATSIDFAATWGHADMAKLFLKMANG